MVATFVMIHVGMYTKVYLSFEKFSKFLKVVLKVLWKVVLKSRQVCFCKFDQVTKSGLPLNLLKDFSMFLTLLTILFHHCIWWTILC